MISSRTVPVAARAFASNVSTKLPQKSGTNVLLLHAGEPRTPFYAREYLTRVWEHYKIPKFLRQSLTNSYWNSSKLLRKCTADCETYPILNEVIADFTSSIEKSLAKITPEFRPVRCKAAFLFDSPQIGEKVEEIIQEGTDNLVVISLYPFENHLTKPLLSSVDHVLQKRTKAFGNGIDEDPSVRVALNSHVSFQHITLSNIGSNESIIQYWAERIRSNLDDYDSIIFATPLPLVKRGKFTQMFNESARRVMYVLYDQYPRAVPWRISYFSSWTQFWPPLTRMTIQNQVKNLRKSGRNRTLVIPMSELFQNFDTETILPALLSSQSDVQLLKPERNGNDKALIHSLTEAVKNSLLQRIAKKEYVSSQSQKLIV